MDYNQRLGNPSTRQFAKLYQKISNEQHQLQQFTSSSNPLKTRLLRHYNSESQQLTRTDDDMGIIGKLILLNRQEQTRLYNNSHKRVIDTEEGTKVINYLKDYESEVDNGDFDQTGYEDSFVDYKLCYNTDGERVTQYVGKEKTSHSVEENDILIDQPLKEDEKEDVDVTGVLDGLFEEEEEEEDKRDEQDEIEILFPSREEELKDVTTTEDPKRHSEDQLIGVTKVNESKGDLEQKILSTTEVGALDCKRLMLGVPEDQVDNNVEEHITTHKEGEKQEIFAEPAFMEDDDEGITTVSSKGSLVGNEESSDITSQHSQNIKEDDLLSSEEYGYDVMTLPTDKQSLSQLADDLTTPANYEDHQTIPSTPNSSESLLSPCLSKPIILEQIFKEEPETMLKHESLAMGEEPKYTNDLIVTDGYVSFGDISDPWTLEGNSIRSSLLVETPTKSNSRDLSTLKQTTTVNNTTKEVQSPRCVTPIKEDYNSLNIPYVLKLRKTPTDNDFKKNESKTEMTGSNKRAVSQLVKSFESTPISSPISSPKTMTTPSFPITSPSTRLQSLGLKHSLKPTIQNSFNKGSSPTLTTPLKIIEPKLILNHITPVKSTTSQMLSRVSINTQTNTSSVSNININVTQTNDDDKGNSSKTKTKNRVNIKEICQMFENQLLINSSPKKSNMLTTDHAREDLHSNDEQSNRDNNSIKRKLLKSNVVKNQIIYESLT